MLFTLVFLVFFPLRLWLLHRKNVSDIATGEQETPSEYLEFFDLKFKKYSEGLVILFYFLRRILISAVFTLV
jgi:hypothetical protein